jgi:hypothetical protein
MHREKPLNAETTADSYDDIILLTTPLERISTQRRTTHANVPFLSLHIKCNKDLYSRVFALSKNNESLTAIDVACEVGAIFGIVIDPSEGRVIGICARNRIKAYHQLRKIFFVVSLEMAVPSVINAPKVNKKNVVRVKIEH